MLRSSLKFCFVVEEQTDRQMNKYRLYSRYIVRKIFIALPIIFMGVSLLSLTPSLNANNPLLADFFTINLILLGVSIIGIGLLTIVGVSDHPEAIRQKQILNNFVSNNKILVGIQDSFLLLLVIGSILIIVDIAMTAQAVSVFGLLMERNVHVRFLLSTGQLPLWVLESITPIVVVGALFYLVKGVGLVSRLFRLTLTFYLIATIIMAQVVLLNNTLVFLRMTG